MAGPRGSSPNATAIEYGYCYQSAAVVPDGSTAPAPADDIRVYQPFTRPGAPLPHAWIDDEDGRRRPVKDLVAPGRFPADRLSEPPAAGALTLVRRTAHGTGRRPREFAVDRLGLRSGKQGLGPS